MIKEGWGTIKEIKKKDTLHFAKVLGTSSNRFLILNSSPLVYEGHYLHGEMIPCAGDNCKVCSAGVGKQIRYCFGVYEFRTNWRCVLELSAKQAEVIFDQYLIGDDSRGLEIVIRKMSEARTSNMKIVEARYVDIGNRKAYDPVDIIGFMEAKWRRVSDSYYVTPEGRTADEVPPSSQAKLKPSEIFESRRKQEEYTPFSNPRT